MPTAKITDKSKASRTIDDRLTQRICCNSLLTKDITFATPGPQQGLIKGFVDF